VDPFASLDFDQVEEVIAIAFAGALKRWPGNISMAAADFQAAAVGSLKSLLAEEIAASYREGVIATIAYILDTHPQHAFIADCIAFSSGLHALQGGLSQTEIAARHGVERATVQKWTKIVRLDLDLPRSRGMRDEDASEAYAERAHRVHGTVRKEPEAKKVKVPTIESLVGRLCRALKSLDPTDMSDAERENLRRSLNQLSPLLPS
jgi:hypothetical protein